MTADLPRLKSKFCHYCKQARYPEQMRIEGKRRICTECIEARRTRQRPPPRLTSKHARKPRP